LAEKIGSSPAYVTKILRGETNFTLDSMVKIATALGCELTIGLRPLPPVATQQRSSKVSYRDIAPQPSSMLNDQPH
jgi:transcriptional regulator with XRE-family HTH domain